MESYTPVKVTFQDPARIYESIGDPLVQTNRRTSCYFYMWIKSERMSILTSIYIALRTKYSLLLNLTLKIKERKGLICRFLLNYFESNIQVFSLTKLRQG